MAKRIDSWIWDFFEPFEMACRCGKCGSTGFEMQPTTMHAIESIRGLYGHPLKITRGYSCPEHNKEVGGAEHSEHLEGYAVDIPVYGLDAFKLIEIAFQFNVSGIGVKQKGPISSRFIHLGWSPNTNGRLRPWIWSY
jgi:uncharacterized protein YcbK (DUF882 family)